ncbi:MAG: transcriptional repressor [Planctomycetes bacterium]|nr:transcriptional repressor [Planctomycetota bacterium]
MKAIKRFTDYLKKNKLKLTNPRLEILEKILKIKKHFNAEELFNVLKNASQNKISRATVYRTLSLLEDACLIESMDFETGFKTYEYIYNVEHHDHIICLDSGRIIEFQNPEIERMQNEIAEELGFDVEYHSLKIYCRRKNPKSGKKTMK